VKWRLLVDALKGLCTTDYYGEDDGNRVFTRHLGATEAKLLPRDLRHGG
jgi:hypothetical protein